jgi:DNA-binding transcriptional LysR family regulator
MEILQLRYFVVLAEELHFHRAAARLSISQPPLSSAIKQMELELGTVLFERTTKAVALTPAGQAFYVEAMRTLAQFDLTCSIARLTGTGGRGQLRLGCTGGMLIRGVPALLRDYERHHPGVDLALREMGSAAQADAITHRRLSGGFLHTAVLPPDLNSVIVQREPFICCLPAEHSLAGRSRISLKLLANEPWVLFARDTSPSYFDSVIALCNAAGFSPRVKHEITHWMSAVMLVAEGGGVAVVPEAFRRMEMPNVRFISVQEDISVSLAHFAWRQDDADPLLAGFLRHLNAWTSTRGLSKRKETRGPKRHA